MVSVGTATGLVRAAGCYLLYKTQRLVAQSPVDWFVFKKVPVQHQTVTVQDRTVPLQYQTVLVRDRTVPVQEQCRFLE